MTMPKRKVRTKAMAMRSGMGKGWKVVTPYTIEKGPFQIEYLPDDNIYEGTVYRNYARDFPTPLKKVAHVGVVEIFTTGRTPTQALNNFERVARWLGKRFILNLKGARRRDSRAN